MTEKRYKAIPETGEYKDTVTGEFLSPKFEEDFYKVLDLLNENEELKQQLEYIQNLISEHIEHQKTELGQKALQKIIEDYNEWLLGHKRDLND